MGKTIRLLVALLLALIISTTFLFGVGGNGDGDGESWVGEGGWDEFWQGYLVTVTTPDGGLVAGPIIYPFSDTGEGVTWYYNNKLGNAATISNVDLGGIFPYPILFSNGAITGNGQAIKAYLTGSKDAMDELLTPIDYSVDKLIEDNNRVLVEPVIWMRPIGKNGSKAPFKIGGSITEIAYWHIQNENLMGNSIGGGMAKLVSDVGPVCMFLEKDDPEMGISSPGQIDGYKSLHAVINKGVGYGLHIYFPDDYGGDKRVIKVYHDKNGVVEQVKEEVIPADSLSYEVKDEGTYKHTDSFWSPQYISKAKISSWGDCLAAYPKNQVWSGNGGSHTKTWGEEDKKLTVYAKYVNESEETNVTGDLILTEQRITRRYTISGQAGKYGGLKFSYPMWNIPFGDGGWEGWTEYQEQVGTKETEVKDANGTVVDVIREPIYETKRRWTVRPCGFKTWVDNSFNTIFYQSKYFSSIDNIIMDHPSDSNWKMRYSDNKMSGNIGTNAASGSATWVQKKIDATFVIYRGDDLPTLASYGTTPNVNDGIRSSMANLGVGSGTAPTKQRKSTSYTKNAPITIKVAADSADLKVTAWCNATSQRDGLIDPRARAHGEDKIHIGEGAPNAPAGSEGIGSNAVTYPFTAAVRVYTGTPNSGSVGAEPLNWTSTLINGKAIGNLAGGSAKQDNLVFYPYTQMHYDTVGAASTPSSQFAMTLAAHESVITPFDFIEFGWTNPASDGVDTELGSMQWSTHERAIAGSEKWKGVGQVLPGGAIYELGNNASHSTIVGLKTWQYVVPDGTKSGDTASYVSQGNNSYTEKNNRHLSALSNLLGGTDKITLDLWVNNDYSASPFLGKIAQAGQELFNAIPLSTLPKYWLQDDGKGSSGGSNEGDYDNTAVDTKTTYYRVHSDTKGTVYLSKGSSLSGGWSTVSSWGKELSAANISASLTGEAYELDRRTRVITNFVNSIDRNKGSDSTFISDSKWYNEAWDGLYIMVCESTYNNKFITPTKRNAVLDPGTTPVLESKGKLLTNAHSAAFKSKDMRISVFFNAVEHRVKNVNNMHRTRTFYIPNATVQDLD